MAPCLITRCTVDDAVAVTYNNMPAFWEDPHWVLTWRHRSLEYHMSQVKNRMPRVLISGRETRRHQKAIDQETGQFLGYACWSLPLSHATNADGTPAWLEALVPAVTSEEETEIHRIAESVPWDPNLAPDVLLEPVMKMKDELEAGKSYMTLDNMAVHPNNQRKGVATALVQSGMVQAEKMGLDIFIHALKAGKAVYERLGFRVLKEIVQDDSMFGGTGEYYVCFMLYEQKPTSDIE